MDHNLSTKSSKSSGEHEIATGSNVTTPKKSCKRKIKKFQKNKDKFFGSILRKRPETEAQIFDFVEERRGLQAKIHKLRLKLHAANERIEEQSRLNRVEIQGCKNIIEHLEEDITTLNESLGSVMNTALKCQEGAAHINIGTHSATERGDQTLNKNANVAPLGLLDPITSQRVRELELKLEHMKLAQVEAECKDLDWNN